MTHLPKAMTIAGSDSGGGAGIQADLKTFTVFGCYGTSAITALTAQNTRGVDSIHPVTPSFLKKQIDAILEDICTDALKIGMLHSREVIRTVRGSIEQHGVRNVVLDPVMVAKSGDRLLQEDAKEALKEELFPQVSLLTPNIPEAAMILKQNPEELEPEDAAKRLASMGPRAVLLKGGHGTGSHCEDLLWDREKGRSYRFSSERIDTPNTHGTGCTLSSAIAAGIAKGNSLEDAVKNAKSFMDGALRSGSLYRVGEGKGPVDHLYRIRE